MKNFNNLFFLFTFRVAVFLLPFFSFLSSAAAEEISVQEKTATEQRGFLFEVEKNGFKSFVFGTVHTGFSPSQLIDVRTTQIIKKSKRLYVEADISDVRKNDKTIAKEGFYNGNLKLASSIDKKNYDFYRSVLVDRGQFLSLEEYENARPWLIAMLVPIADSLSESYPLLKFGSDIQIIKMAKENKIPLIEMEGISRQAQFYSSMTGDIEKNYLTAYVELVKSRIIYERIFSEISAWTLTDFENLEMIINKARKKKDAYSLFYFENIIDKRNEGFINIIADASENVDGGFFAVGCEHLVGKTGVVQGLRNRGYSVKQVKY